MLTRSYFPDCNYLDPPPILPLLLLMEAGYSEHQLCVYADSPAAPPYFVSAAPCVGCRQPVQVHPDYTSHLTLCDACLSMAFALHSNGAAGAATNETPESSSGDYGDSKYGDDPETTHDRLHDLESENPEVTSVPPAEAAPCDNTGFAPPPLDVYRKYSAPVPSRQGPIAQSLFDELAQLFAGEATTSWSGHKDTWLRVTYSGLGRLIEPLPAQMALIAEKLRYEYPTGIICFYLDAQSVNHVRTGNETIPTTVSTAISLLRSKHGLCGLCFTGKRVGILEALTWPTQTSHASEIAARIEEAATSRDVQRPRRKRPQWWRN